MRIDYPAPRQLPQLRQLWQNAFGDTDDFLDCFYSTAYAPRRCRCVLAGEDVAAALYWIDCLLGNRKLAYIYAVATHPGHRGKGLCRMLMEDTHVLLAAQGYAGTVLVPQQESLRRMYAGMGYENAGGLTELHCMAEDPPAALRAVGPVEFAALRRKFMPENSVIQEGEGLHFLSLQLQFYAGDHFLLAAYGQKDTLNGVELLGNIGSAPGILKALGYSHGVFRTPGNSPFAMFHSLSGDCAPPAYFGFAFD